MASPEPKRCAIYTRKSSEEGLEQEYNSLDAQRDAAEAFIRSQKHEGWKPIKDGYDDGGISGGHMERPSLQRLIRDIAAGKIDVVVVYKVDRLSRSLADFAQLMQLFDKHGVSFVSVTQQFNTSSSMGRLTLNVLLSFAQFEREVTGERIRDKIALSKKKGMWMGGIPPLGYDVLERKLKINPVEAEVVRSCFQIYLQCSGLIETVLELNRRGLKTKSFTSVKGRTQEAQPWVAKQLHRTLTQPIYQGKVRHQNQLFDGEHVAIIGESMWNEVQKKLRENQPGVGKIGGHFNETAIEQTKLIHPLKGFVHSMDGHALTPTHTNKSEVRSDGIKFRKRYRYYVSQQAIRQGYSSSSIKTINADLLEDAVQQMLVQSLPGLAASIVIDGLTTDQVVCRMTGHAAAIAGMDSPLELAEVIHLLSPKIVVGPERIQIHLAIEKIQRMAEQRVNVSVELVAHRPMPLTMEVEAETVIISSMVQLTARRGRAEIVDGQTGEVVSSSVTEPKPVLIQAIVQAEYWRGELEKHPSKSLNDVLEPYGVQPTYVRRLLNAAYLAPSIKRAIFQGTQSATLQVQDLLKPRSLDWEIQMRELGFSLKETSARR